MLLVFYCHLCAVHHYRTRPRIYRYTMGIEISVRTVDHALCGKFESEINTPPPSTQQKLDMKPWKIYHVHS
jgi:hypothetical protein